MDAWVVALLYGWSLHHTGGSFVIISFNLQDGIDGRIKSWVFQEEFCVRTGQVLWYGVRNILQGSARFTTCRRVMDVDFPTLLCFGNFFSSYTFSKWR